MGTSLNVSTPPAMIVEALPDRIFSAALVMATLDEMIQWWFEDSSAGGEPVREKRKS